MPFYRELSMTECWGGIWKITESWEELCHMLPRETCHRVYVLQHFKAEKRRLEYAAVRVLLFWLTGEDSDVAYYPSGRPYFADFHCYLSISHTAGYAAVLLSRTCRTGIDIEACSSRILRLKKRIVGQNERAGSLFELLLHWSAKETAFKMLDKEGIDFIEHLQVMDLSCEADEMKPETHGDFKLSYRLPDGRAGIFQIHYLTMQDFVLTYARDGITGSEACF